MFGFQKKMTPEELASDLLAWVDTISKEDILSRLPSDAEADMWWFEGRILIAAGVIHGCRVGNCARRTGTGSG